VATRTPVKKAAASKVQPGKARSAPRKAATGAGKAVTSSATPSVQVKLKTALAGLRAASTQRDLDNLPRFGIAATNPLGVSMANIQAIAKRLGRSHELAAALWETNCYEARMLAAFVEEPGLVTAAQMERWCRDFDNWGICDTVCFKLFDQLPHAWKKVEQWQDRKEEFVRRAAFALLASLALHSKTSSKADFLRSMPWMERGASDGRNFVWKGVSWALRSVGRRDKPLNTASVALARKLAASTDPTSRKVGKEAFKELTSAAVLRRLA